MFTSARIITSLKESIPRKETTHYPHVDEKIPLKPALFDWAMGVEQGVLQAAGTWLLNPMDKLHTQLTAINKMSQQSHVPVFDKLFVNRGLTKGLYSGAYFNFKQNVFRNSLMLPVLPICYDLLYNYYGFSPLSSKVLSSLGVGLIDTVFAAKKEVVKVVTWAREHENVEAAEKAISPKEMKAMKLNAIKWRAGRSLTYWGTMPIAADVIQQRIEGSAYLRSGFLKDADAAAMIAGGLAGFGSSALSYPFEVIKIRKINDPGHKIFEPIKECFKNQGFFKAAIQCVREQTHPRFMLASARVAIASAMFQWTKDKAAESCGHYFAKKM